MTRFGTRAGRSPVTEFIMCLPMDDRAAIGATMEDVRNHGNSRGEIYEVIA